MVFNKIEDIVKQQETSIDGSRAEVSWHDNWNIFSITFECFFWVSKFKLLQFQELKRTV